MQSCRRTFAMGLVGTIVAGLWAFAWVDSLHRGPNNLPPFMNYSHPMSAIPAGWDMIVDLTSEAT
jgi:hypothetical protein